MKKRSLFVATAMLLVAVLVATGATYAWFSAEKDTANTNIVLGVDDVDSLQISADKSIWKSTLRATDFDVASNSVKWSDSKWVDLSTVDGVSFFEEQYDADGAMLDTYADANAKAVVAKVYFRSTKSDNVVFQSGKLACAVEGSANTTWNLDSALRVAVVQNDNSSAIYANTATTLNSAIKAADEKAQQSAIAFADAVVVDLSDAPNAQGFYEGEATFKFWVEGTDENCTNGNLESKMSAAFEAVFAQ